jgi:predicted kinase
VFLEVATNVSEEHAASIFTTDVIRVRMQPGYIDRMTRNTVIQK